MNTIEVDFDVWKELTNRRSSEEVTYNDVLRELLELPVKVKKTITLQSSIARRYDWVTKGVHFPDGTEFRANYNGQMYYGKVEKGRLVVNDKRFNSPSAAAKSITDNSVNGWTFWECRMLGQSNWQMIKSLRRR